MPGPSCSAEIVVVGAGPAGCAAAIRLAQLGHAVMLIERGGPGRPAALESAPALLLPLLQSLGLGPALLDAGFARPGTGVVQWAGPPQAVQAPEAGFQLERERFDALLRHGARAAGVRWLAPAAARPPQRVGAGGHAHWLLPLHDGRVVRAEGVLWATGRAGRPVAGAVPSAALVGQWRLGPHHAPGGAGGDTSAVRVQAGRLGWAWAACGPAGEATLALFVDIEHLRGLGPAARQAFYCRELQALSLMSPLLAGAALIRLRVADATPRWQQTCLGPGGWRIGEAALSLDPLSSQGVVSALRSGVQAAVAMHTWRQRPEHAALASAFLHDQQARDLLRHRRWSQAFHAEAAQAWATAFWQRRCAPQGGDLAAPLEPADTTRPMPALAQPVGLDAQARVETAAVLDGEWIGAALVLEHARLAGPVAHVGGVPVTRLLHPLAAPATAGTVLRAWADRLGPRAATELFQRWWRLGVLVDASSGAAAASVPSIASSGTSRTVAGEVSIATTGTTTP